MIVVLQGLPTRISLLRVVPAAWRGGGRHGKSAIALVSAAILLRAHTNLSSQSGCFARGTEANNAIAYARNEAVSGI